MRAEPRSFNRLLAGDRATLIVSQLINEPLVRVNHVTQALEPALASAWTADADGRSISASCDGTMSRRSLASRGNGVPSSAVRQ